MTIVATYAKIVDLAEGTTGIYAAPDEIPASVPVTDLPFIVTRVGPATWNEHAVGLFRQVRWYYLDCYVKPIAEGVTPDEGYKACLTPLYNLGRTFVQNGTLDGTVDQVGEGDRPIFEDSGVRSDLTFGGIAYHGFTLSLQVTEKAS